ncbi:MAG: TetR/AcrR family transcriptional regulator [Thermodesulfobacteriota bacterium]
MPDPAENPRMQDRALETRRRLLDATVKSLVEKGYAGTTTQEVCRRAGASRGTLLHHFPTREDLLITAVEHVLEENVRSFQQALDGATGGEHSLSALARALWERHWTSDPFYAWLELIVASRTDSLLNDRVRTMSAWWMARFSEAFRALFSHEPDGPFWLFFLVLNALSVERIHSDPAKVDRALDDLFALVGILDRFFIRFEGLPETPARTMPQKEKKGP